MRAPPDVSNWRKTKHLGVSKDKLDEVAPTYTGWTAPKPTIVIDGKIGTDTTIADRETENEHGNEDESEGVEDCTICLEDVTETETKRKLLCQHTYHAHCIEAWASKKNQCPNCRESIFPKSRGSLIGLAQIGPVPDFPNRSRPTQSESDLDQADTAY